LREQSAALEAERRALLHSSQDASIEQVRQLLPLKGIGLNGSWLLVREFFAWRDVKHRREVGGFAGGTPTPYHSGERAREQDIIKSGNRHVRGLTVEAARWTSGPCTAAVGELGAPPTGLPALVAGRREHRVTGV
jgi:transposase